MREIERMMYSAFVVISNRIEKFIEALQRILHQGRWTDEGNQKLSV